MNTGKLPEPTLSTSSDIHPEECLDREANWSQTNNLSAMTVTTAVTNNNEGLASPSASSLTNNVGESNQNPASGGAEAEQHQMAFAQFPIAHKTKDQDSTYPHNGHHNEDKNSTLSTSGNAAAVEPFTANHNQLNHHLNGNPSDADGSPPDNNSTTMHNNNNNNNGDQNGAGGGDCHDALQSPHVIPRLTSSHCMRTVEMRLASAVQAARALYHTSIDPSSFSVATSNSGSPMMMMGGGGGAVDGNLSAMGGGINNGFHSLESSLTGFPGGAGRPPIAREPSGGNLPMPSRPPMSPTAQRRNHKFHLPLSGVVEEDIPVRVKAIREKRRAMWAAANMNMEEDDED